jgi:hypothetical protein
MEEQKWRSRLESFESFTLVGSSGCLEMERTGEERRGGVSMLIHSVTEAIGVRSVSATESLNQGLWNPFNLRKQ